MGPPGVPFRLEPRLGLPFRRAFGDPPWKRPVEPITATPFVGP
jgi:hypothetical protein